MTGGREPILQAGLDEAEDGGLGTWIVAGDGVEMEAAG